MKMTESKDKTRAKNYVSIGMPEAKLTDRAARKSSKNTLFKDMLKHMSLDTDITVEDVIRLGKYEEGENYPWVANENAK